jgi:hypothetical protein
MQTLSAALSRGFEPFHDALLNSASLAAAR